MELHLTENDCRAVCVGLGMMFSHKLRLLHLLTSVKSSKSNLIEQTKRYPEQRGFKQSDTKRQRIEHQSLSDKDTLTRRKQT
eukprot:2904552-Amphidinium_carterae.1